MSFSKFVRNWTPLGWYQKLVGAIFGSPREGMDITDQIGRALGRLDIEKVLENLEDEYLGTGITDKSKEEIDYSTNAQYELWRKTQSMPAQVAQYREAGLNPMMLANGSGVGSVPSASGASGSPADLLGFVTQLLDFSLKKKMTDADIQVRQATAEGMNIDNAWKERMNKANYLRTMADASFITQNTQKIFQDTRFAEIYADFAPQLFSLQLEQGNAEIQSTLQGIVESMSRVVVNQHDIQRIDAIVQQHRKTCDEIDANIIKIQQECLTLAKSREVSDQNIAESKKRCEEIEKHIEKLGKEIGLLGKDLDYYVWNHSWKSKVNMFGLGYEKMMNPDEASAYENLLGEGSVDGKLLQVTPYRQGASAWETLSRLWWNQTHQ